MRHTSLASPALPFTVGAEMLGVVLQLWTRDYHTVSSCQADPNADGWAELTFSRPADAQRLVAVCATAAQAWDDPAFFSRVTGATFGGGTEHGPDTWRVEARIARAAIFSSGQPGLWPLLVTLYLPPRDLPLVEKALVEFSGYSIER